MLSAGDKVVLSLMVFIPLAIVLFFVWFPAIATVFLSFTTWSGIGGLKAIHADGIQNYHQIATNYPPFVPALEHNVLWLVVFICFATPLGILIAVLLDQKIRGSRDLSELALPAGHAVACADRHHLGAHVLEQLRFDQQLDWP